MPTDEMYTVEQAATLAGVDADTIRLAVRAGKLRAWSLPTQRGLLVRKSDVVRWHAFRERPAPTDPDDQAYGLTTTNIAPWDVPVEEEV